MQQHERRNLRLSLASLDALGSDAELRAQAEQVRREAETQPAPDSPAGHDQTGSITVHTDREGHVKDVAVLRDWRARLTPGEVPDALFEAYSAAMRAVVELAAIRRLTDDPTEGSPAAARPGTRYDDELDEHLWLRRTWRTLHEIDADLERLARQPDMPVEKTITSLNGCLTLHLRGSGITAITGSVERIGRLDAGELRFEARSLFQAHALASSRADHEGDR
ncbi:hypothetical protein [Micromonospora coxensis]|uniref:YbaB/EbfC DNA-binding family protein n=1 Tax=Micromonospora coxensis TaxID=356852 RepID=A0A1C5GWX0_9ACTN|nr:hypothetical protein [Micromonospora coxensis]SCG38292.1 hypothetical protein GA0070614_0499 [Micromonospora coxensis]